MDYAQLFAGVPVEPKRYVATFQGNDPQNDYEPATVTVEVSDWVYEGKPVMLLTTGLMSDSTKAILN